MRVRLGFKKTQDGKQVCCEGGWLWKSLWQKSLTSTGGAGCVGAGGGGGVDNNLCRCFHCDYSRLGVLLDDGSCHLSTRQTAGPTLVNCCVTRALSSLYIRAPPTPSYQPCISPANWLKRTPPPQPYQPGSIPCRLSKSISLLERRKSWSEC